ncbi:MAG: OB-fold domain-containing protein [Leptospira sp.]|nr:OB-fold domain-containing protein [Leptospira sp.]
MPASLDLQGYHCKDCKFTVIENFNDCPSCGGHNLETIHVSPNGHIYTFTIVHVGFGHMAERAPYALTIVETEDKIKLTTVLEDVEDFSMIKIGQKVKLKRFDEKIGPVFRLEN